MAPINNNKHDLRSSFVRWDIHPLSINLSSVDTFSRGIESDDLSRDYHLELEFSIDAILGRTPKKEVFTIILLPKRIKTISVE